MEEEWKPITGYEESYEVSNLGGVRNIKYKKIMSPRRRSNTGSYTSLSVCLYQRGVGKEKLVSRLVAQEFIPNPNCKSDVNHIDSNPQNNHISNLEWLSHKENMEHASKSGRLSISRRSRRTK